MAIVFKTPLNTKNLTTNDSQNIDSPIGCNLEAGSVEYNENGEYTLEPESADGFSSVEITVDVPSNVNNQEKSVTISTNGTSTITYDANYTGLSSVGITVDVEPDLEAKTVEYTANNTYTIAPSSGKDGISSATVTVNVDTVTPYNEGKAAGIAEQKAKLESATFVSNGTYTKEDGYNSVTVAVPSDINNQNKTATPSTSAQEITADSGYSGLGKVTISAVTAAIDSDIVAGNIKKDVEILGVTGTYDPQPELQDKTVTPSTSQQVISADSGYDGLDEVTVSAVTSSIDANIAAGNIKDGVTILGVTGTYTGGGSACVDWSSMGWNCQDVVDSGITPDVAYTASVKDNNSWTNDTQLVFAPKTSNSRNGGIFYGCSELKFVPDFTITSQEAPLYEMFRDCVELEGVGIITCPNKVQNNYADNAFYNCKRLKEVKSIDMNHSTKANYMFYDCEKLTSVSFTNVGSVTSTNSMFSGCSSLTSIPTFDFSHTTEAGRMFVGCTGLTTVNLSLPAANDSTASWYLFWNCTGLTSATLSAPLQPRWGYTFSGCTSLQTATITMGSNVTEVDKMFANCTSLTTVANFDASGLKGTWNMFEGCSALTTLGGFTGLGTAYTGTSNHNLDLSASSVLTKTSIMNVINELGTATAGTNATLTLSAASYALLDASEIAIATAKNWSVVSA